MKSIILTAAFLCLLSTISFAQLQVDASAGYMNRPTPLSIKTNGYFISASPSLPLNDKIRLHAGLQFRQEIRENNSNLSNIDISPTVEYDLFKFLSVSGGLYYSIDVSSLRTADRDAYVELGPIGMLKLKHDNAFVVLRYNMPIVGQVENFLNGDRAFNQTSFLGGVIQIGLGYTFAKK